MNESTVFIPGRKGPFLFALIFYSLAFLIVPIAFFTLPYDVIMITAAILFFSVLLGNGYKVLNRLRKNKVGLFITNAHLEDYSLISYVQKVKLSNIATTKIKSAWGNELLAIQLKNKRDFMKTVPLLRRPIYWMNSIFYGAPVVIIKSNIQRTLEHVKMLIDERINSD